MLDMYKAIKSKAKIGQHLSKYFMCKIRVSQRENLSSFLFSLFIYDLDDYWVFIKKPDRRFYTCPNLQIQDDLFVMLTLNKLSSFLCWLHCIDIWMSVWFTKVTRCVSRLLWILKTACQYSKNKIKGPHCFKRFDVQS